jgi:hypothetical protein
MFLLHTCFARLAVLMAQRHEMPYTAICFTIRHAISQNSSRQPAARKRPAMLLFRLGVYKARRPLSTAAWLAPHPENSKIFAFLIKIVLSGTDRLASAPAASQQRRPGATSLGYAAFEPFSKGLFNASSSRSGYGISSAPIVRTKPGAPQIPSIYGIGLRAQAISLRGSMLNSKKPINFFGTCFGAGIALLEGNSVGPGPGAAVPKIEAAR